MYVLHSGASGDCRLSLAVTAERAVVPVLQSQPLQALDTVFMLPPAEEPPAPQRALSMGSAGACPQCGPRRSCTKAIAHRAMFGAVVAPCMISKVHDYARYGSRGLVWGWGGAYFLVGAPAACRSSTNK